MHGQTLAASFVVGLMPFNSVEVPDADDVLVALAASVEGARFAELDGAPAVRTESLADPSPGTADDERQYGSRQVAYVVAVPGARDTWLSVTFSTVGDGDPTGEVADVLVDLFDAAVLTLRWVFETAPAP